MPGAVCRVREVPMACIPLADWSADESGRRAQVRGINGGLAPHTRFSHPLLTLASHRGVKSRPMSAAGALCVSRPTDT